ncbi:MAG: SUF system NifU family Fe-S cluster assembly protein [Firmicutes bacterium]|nr:SUF system NifU family Fe-S cluster assembly protein [Bacillota bacterium]
MDQNLKRTLILEHYQNPLNKGLSDNQDYIYTDMNNESCIDEVHLMTKVENGVIQDIHFDGEACAICTSSTSIMIETLLGKTVEEATEIIKNFKNMVDEKEYNGDILESALSFDDIYKQPSRKKCALLSWWGMEKTLDQVEKKSEEHE